MLVRQISIVKSVSLAMVLGLAASGATWAQVRPGDGAGQPVAPEEMIEQALDMIDAGDFQEAMTLLQRAKMLKPTLDKLNLAEGLLSIEGKSSMKAIQQLQAYNKSEEGRNDYRGYVAIGRIYQGSGMNRQAVPSLEKAKELAPLEKDGKPLRAEIATDLAMAYYRLDRKDKAIESARDAERWSPDDPRVQLRLAQFASSTDDHDTAAKAVEKAIKLAKVKLQMDPLDKDIYDSLRQCYQLALTFQRQDSLARSEDGLPFFNMAVIAREDAEAMKRIGLLSARELALEALTKEPNKPEWKVFVARVEADLGAVDEAMRKLEEVLSADPDNEEANKLRQYIRTGSGGP